MNGQNVARNLFVILPALTIVYVISDAIPISDILRSLATHWRQLTHDLIRQLIATVPFIPQLDLPSIVLDQISICILLAGSIWTRVFVEFLFGARAKRATQVMQLTPQYFWISVLILFMLFFLVYDVKYYAQLLHSRETDVPETFVLSSIITDEKFRIPAVMGSMLWVLIFLFLMMDLGVPTKMRGVRGWKRLYVLAQPHNIRLLMLIIVISFLAFSQWMTIYETSEDVPYVRLISVITLIFICTIITFLRLHNRNTIAITLAVAAGIIVADRALILIAQIWQTVVAG